MKGLIRNKGSLFLLLLDQKQMKQFPNPLLIFLTDDFVTRTIVGVTLPLGARNYLERSGVPIVATFTE